MRRLLLSSLVFALGGCLFVPDNEGTLTFNYLILRQDAPGVIGALLCDNPEVSSPAGSGFVKSDIATIAVIGISRRGLEVRREAECFYQPQNAAIDSVEELGTLSVTLPADTYEQIKIQLLDINGAAILWGNDPNDPPRQEINILQGLVTVDLQKEATLDLGPTIVQLGEDGAVSDELALFVP